MQRRLEILIAIDAGKNTIQLITVETGIPIPSIKRNLVKLKLDFNVRIDFIRTGSVPVFGYYIIVDWGIINRDELLLFKLNGFQ